MTPATRQQLEERLSQLDDAILTLRRGFARRGERPPDVCSLMQQERNDVARLLKLDRALDQAARTVEWTADSLQRTPPTGTRLPRTSFWDRARAFCRSFFSNPRHDER